MKKENPTAAGAPSAADNLNSSHIARRYDSALLIPTICELTIHEVPNPTISRWLVQPRSVGLVCLIEETRDVLVGIIVFV